MTKRIPLAPVLNMEGKPWKVPKVDEDGDIVWKTEPVGEQGGVPELEPADTRRVIQTALFSIPRAIQSSHDPMRVAMCFNELEHSAGDGFIELKDKVYAWLHRLLRRELPLTKEQKDLNMPVATYAQALWQLNAFIITEQLKDVDERKDLSELEFPE